ncbi:hypothetical protein DFR72_109250 [Lentzea flaviverrucosa]|jgi:hypothetical protein|uniref:Uncharacterized protein n=1 Tax=Lentzea flaviverrucosa TaxID=200379 RepID=A0A1H9CWJ2_9PSEU|nr:hypothetical protein DFR72_109250 [Lentzea flaviverrucosa]SEQ05606.1 hypothetical protein SAMN05216195_101905 [Lentzea flaviverrucosa]
MRLVLWLTLAGVFALSGDHALAAVLVVLLVGCATDRVR